MERARTRHHIAQPDQVVPQACGALVAPLGLLFQQSHHDVGQRSGRVAFDPVVVEALVGAPDIDRLQ